MRICDNCKLPKIQALYTIQHKSNPYAKLVCDEYWNKISREINREINRAND